MNETQLRTLVDRHRDEVLIGAPPPDLLVTARRERRAGRRRTTARVLGAVAAVAVVVAGGSLLHDRPDTRPASPSTPSTTAPTTSPPPDPGPPTRAVGVNGWALRVPASWGTDRVGCNLRTPLQPTVIFDHHYQVWPACGVIVDHELPSVTISDSPAPGGRPWRTIAGVPVEQVPDKGACGTCLTLTVPSAPATFTIHARTPAQLSAISGSLQRLPSRTVTVPIWISSVHAPQDQMTQRVLGAGLRPTVVEEPGGIRPGDFVRTEPPIGTPVSAGRHVLVVYSTGNLSYYATPASLRRHGWSVQPATSYDTRVTRPEAVHRVVGDAPTRELANTDAFLRLLSVHGQDPRLAWLVVARSTYDGRGNLTRLEALDARTGRPLATVDDLHGTS